MARRNLDSVQALAASERRSEVARLHLQKKSVRQIAAILSCGTATVGRDIRKVEAEYDRQTFDLLDGHRARLIGELNLAQREAFEAWEKSKQSAVTTNAKVRKKGGGEGAAGSDQQTETSRREEQQVGDARYLAAFIDCTREKAKLLRLYRQDEGELPAVVQLDPEHQGPTQILVNGDLVVGDVALRQVAASLRAIARGELPEAGQEPATVEVANGDQE